MISYCFDVDAGWTGAVRWIIENEETPKHYLVIIHDASLVLVNAPDWLLSPFQNDKRDKPHCDDLLSARYSHAIYYMMSAGERLFS
jgi:hypothetical protein